MRPEIDILSIDRGSVTAPAGCGKTQLIAETLSAHRGPKPILVLTHTNSGVAALRSRLDRACISPKSYRLSTIDGWSMRIAAMFPKNSQIEPETLKLNNPRVDYPAIREAAARLLEPGHLHDLVMSSYDRLIVDEYQDCLLPQHRLVVGISVSIPCCVLGDPMQAIFGFAGRLVEWEVDVTDHFPPIGELTKPWRWINAGAEELGQWLLQARASLRNRSSLDMRAAPTHVRWIELDGTENHLRRLKACRVKAPNSGSVLIIGDSTNPRSQRQIASQTPGATTIESVELGDLINFARVFDATKPTSLKHLLEFGESVMTNIGAGHTIDRIRSIKSGKARLEPNALEMAALKYEEVPCSEHAISVLVEMNKSPGVRAHRSIVLGACIRALRRCMTGTSFYEAAVQMREQNRIIGRQIPGRAVGSTLLLKGLEASAAVILDADQLDARNLYVALTRGSNLLVVCSRDCILSC